MKARVRVRVRVRVRASRRCWSSRGTPSRDWMKARVRVRVKFIIG